MRIFSPLCIQDQPGFIRERQLVVLLTKRSLRSLNHDSEQRYDPESHRSQRELRRGVKLPQHNSIKPAEKGHAAQDPCGLQKEATTENRADEKLLENPM